MVQDLPCAAKRCLNPAQVKPNTNDANLTILTTIKINKKEATATLLNRGSLEHVRGVPQRCTFGLPFFLPSLPSC